MLETLKSTTNLNQGTMEKLLQLQDDEKNI